MIIVMSVGATEQEASNVRDQLRSLRAARARQLRHAASGDRGAGRRGSGKGSSDEQAVRNARRRIGDPDQPPFQADVAGSRTPRTRRSRCWAPKSATATLTIMAGPCSIEGREMMIETARSVAAAGATILRGGAFKPRTSPYAFQGLGVEGLRYLAEASKETGPADHHRGHGTEPGRGRGQARRTSSRSAPGTCRTTRC